MEQLQEKVEKAQGEIYRLKARLENAQSEKDSVQEELERAQATVARQHSERERWVNEVGAAWYPSLLIFFFFFLWVYSLHEAQEDALDAVMYTVFLNSLFSPAQ